MFCFGLTDDAVSLRVFAWGNISVECGVLECHWNDRDIPQSVCVIAVSCEYLLAVFENLSSSLLKRARQLSLQSCPMYRRLPVRRLGRIFPVWY